MKLISNKKGAENWVPADMPFLIIFAIVLGFSLAILLIIMNIFISISTQIPRNVEGSILIQRFYNSPNCFAYQDENNGRVYSNLIDLEKFKNKDIMDKCFHSSNYPYSFKFELEAPENLEKITTSTPNWIENSNFRFEQKNVLVYFNNKIKSAKLSIFIQSV